MKKTLIVLLTLVLILSAPISTLADNEEAIADKSFQPVELDGKKVEISAYLINGENYFKIRDLAAILKDTEGKFDVTFNEEDFSVILEKEGEYEPIEGDLEELPEGKQKAIQSLHPVYLKGEEEPLEIKSYNILGNNYFRLRDLGEVLGFGVAYDFNDHVVMLSTTDLDLEDIKAEEDIKSDEEKYKNSRYYDLLGLEIGTNEFYIEEKGPGDDKYINYILIDNDLKEQVFMNTFLTDILFDHTIQIDSIEATDNGFILKGAGTVTVNGEVYFLSSIEYKVENLNDEKLNLNQNIAYDIEYLELLSYEF